MSQHETNKFVLITGMIVGIAVTIVIFTGHLTARPQLSQVPATESNESKDVFKVGTYRPQAAFEKHPLHKKLMEKYTSLQTEIQGAQQEGDQQKVKQLQQKFEQHRTQIVEQFQSDVKEAFPEVAEETGIKVIALQIAYTANDVAMQDVTEHIVEIFTEKDEKESAEPQFQFPSQQ